MNKFLKTLIIKIISSCIAIFLSFNVYSCPLLTTSNSRTSLRVNLMMDDAGRDSDVQRFRVAIEHYREQNNIAISPLQSAISYREALSFIDPALAEYLSYKFYFYGNVDLFYAWAYQIMQMYDRYKKNPELFMKRLVETEVNRYGVLPEEQPIYVLSFLKYILERDAIPIFIERAAHPISDTWKILVDSLLAENMLEAKPRQSKNLLITTHGEGGLQDREGIFPLAVNINGVLRDNERNKILTEEKKEELRYVYNNALKETERAELNNYLLSTQGKKFLPLLEQREISVGELVGYIANTGIDKRAAKVIQQRALLNYLFADLIENDIEKSLGIFLDEWSMKEEAFGLPLSVRLSTEELSLFKNNMIKIFGEDLIMRKDNRKKVLDAYKRLQDEIFKPKTIVRSLRYSISPLLNRLLEDTEFAKEINNQRIVFFDRATGSNTTCIMSHLLIKAFNPTASSEFVVFTYRKPIKKAGESEFIDHALFFDSVFLLENNTDLYTGFTEVTEGKSRYIKFTQYEELRAQFLNQAANIRIGEGDLDLISKERRSFLGKCKIISGGQTGADRGALEGAKRAGLLTGGYAPKGYRTETGNDFSLVQLGIEEHFSYHYPMRTEQNIVDSDGTVIFTQEGRDLGTTLTLRLVKEHNKPYIVNPTEEELREFAKDKSIINVAGDRESTAPGIQQRVAKTIEGAFKRESTDETGNLEHIKQFLNKPLSNRSVTLLQEELKRQLDSFWDNNRDLLEGLKYINLHRASEKLDFFRIILQYYLDGRQSALARLVIYDYFCEYHGECDAYNNRLSSVVKDNVNTLLKRLEEKERTNTFYFGQLRKLNELLRPISETEILDYFKQVRQRYITRQRNAVSTLALPQNRQVVVGYLKDIVEGDKVISSLLNTIRYLDDIETTDMESMAIHTINTIITDLDNTAAKLNENVDERILSEWIRFLEANPKQRRIVILSDANEGSLAVRVEPFIPKHLLSNFIFSEVGGNVTYYYDLTGQKVYFYDKKQIAEEMDRDSDAILEVIGSVVGIDAFHEDMSAEHISSFRKTFKLNDANKESWSEYIPRIKYELARRGLYNYSVYLSGRKTLRITTKNKRIVLKDIKNKFNLDKESMLVLGDGGFKYHNDWYMWSYPRDAVKVNVGIAYSIPMFEGKNYIHVPDTFVEGTLAALRFLNEKDGSISIYDLLTHYFDRFNKMVIFNGLSQSIKALQSNI